jgi:hypothetical protein
MLQDCLHRREQRIHDYFYGTSLNPLVPVTQTARADQLMVYRIGESSLRCKLLS